MTTNDVKRGICLTCGTPLTSATSFGYCFPCGVKAHEELDAKYPFDVYDGNDCLIESFKTKDEAEDFVFKMKYCRIEKKS